MRVHLILVFEINWDEFLNLSMVYDYARGDLDEVLQTPFIHLFHWLSIVSVNEVDQVIFGRLLVVIAAIVTTVSIYKITRKFASVEAALFAILSYWSFTFVLRHGIALRTDPMATAAMMAALFFVVSDAARTRNLILAGFFTGLAGLFSIKAVFYLPILVILVLFDIQNERNLRQKLISILIGGGVGGVVFLVVLAIHAQGFENLNSPFAFVARTSSATLGTMDYRIFQRSIVIAVLQNPIFVCVLSVGLIAVLQMVFVTKTRKGGVCLLGLVSLLLTPLVYRDVYPYYFVFMLAPVVVVVGVGFDYLTKERPAFFQMILVGSLVLPTIFLYPKSVRQSVDVQRQTLAVIHQVFPDPVDYIDGRSMVSSFPKRGLFMSNWGLTDYRAVGVPIMADVISKFQPQFVLANHRLLKVGGKNTKPAGLFDQDVKALGANYVHYWGPIYVPGFELAEGEATLSVRISGAYLSGVDIEVDGQLVKAGEVVDLTVGEHRIALSRPTTLKLRLPEAPNAEFKGPLFKGF